MLLPADKTRVITDLTIFILHCLQHIIYHIINQILIYQTPVYLHSIEWAISNQQHCFHHHHREINDHQKITSMDKPIDHFSSSRYTASHLSETYLKIFRLWKKMPPLLAQKVSDQDWLMGIRKLSQLTYIHIARAPNKLIKVYSKPKLDLISWTWIRSTQVC